MVGTGDEVFNGRPPLTGLNLVLGASCFFHFFFIVVELDRAHFAVVA